MVLNLTEMADAEMTDQDIANEIKDLVNRINHGVQEANHAGLEVVFEARSFRTMHEGIQRHQLDVFVRRPL